MGAALPLDFGRGLYAHYRLTEALYNKRKAIETAHLSLDAPDTPPQVHAFFASPQSCSLCIKHRSSGAPSDKFAVVRSFIYIHSSLVRYSPPCPTCREQLSRSNDTYNYGCMGFAVRIRFRQSTSSSLSRSNSFIFFIEPMDLLVTVHCQVVVR